MIIHSGTEPNSKTEGKRERERGHTTGLFLLGSGRGRSGSAAGCRRGSGGGAWREDDRGLIHRHRARERIRHVRTRRDARCNAVSFRVSSEKHECVKEKEVFA